MTQLELFPTICRTINFQDEFYFMTILQHKEVTIRTSANGREGSSRAALTGYTLENKPSGTAKDSQEEGKIFFEHRDISVTLKNNRKTISTASVDVGTGHVLGRDRLGQSQSLDKRM